MTTLKIDEANRMVTSCIGCDRCLEACPTGVLSDGNFDRNICLSHITQKKGEIPKEYEDLMIKYHCAWGCDICQKVCPMNQKVQVTFIKEFCERNEATVAIGCDIKGRAFAWRGEKVIERNLKILDTDKKE
ncbi:Epoxyqueuosine reductase [bioreactor metagenome]|uniref:Epoxyqueuosine reductase n=1 Tax=bioreactor metagenome TaxID=1076179 RepID=A0A645I691_9ZZZZ